MLHSNMAAGQIPREEGGGLLIKLHYLLPIVRKKNKTAGDILYWTYADGLMVLISKINFSKSMLLITHMQQKYCLEVKMDIIISIYLM